MDIRFSRKTKEQGSPLISGNPLLHLKMRRHIKILGIWILICTCFAVTAIPIAATTKFDGEYNIIMFGRIWTPSAGWENITAYSTDLVEGFLTISDGHISNVYVESLYNRSDTPSGVESPIGVWWWTWNGTIDDDGNARWTGGSLAACGNCEYTFVGSVTSDEMGSGSGTWSAPEMEHGTWKVYKVASRVDIIDQITNSVKQIINPIIDQVLDIFGLKGSAQARSALIYVGVFAIIGIPVSVIYRIRRSKRKARSKIAMNKTTMEKASESETVSEVPHEIKYEGTSVGGIGLQYGLRPPSPPRLTHVDFAGSEVSLAWEQPDFDADGMYEMYHLDGYEIVERRYIGTESPAYIVVGKLPKDAVAWEHAFKQTYKFCTSGDIEGYNVNALVSYTDSDGYKHVLRLAATAHAPI